MGGRARHVSFRSTGRTAHAVCSDGAGGCWLLAVGGAYYGPTGDSEKRGPLGFAKMPLAAADRSNSDALWQLSERLTGVTYR